MTYYSYGLTVIFHQRDHPGLGAHIRFMIILGKTVYILGAGASHHAGVPLMRDFLDKSLRLLSSTPTLDNAESFHRIADWAGSIKKSSANSLVDVMNIEEAYSLLYMQKEAGIEGAKELFDHLRKVMCETIDHYGTVAALGKEFDNQTQREYRIWADEVFQEFAQSFSTFNQTREGQSQSDYAKAHFASDSIITFNYDMLLDLSFGNLKLPLNYGYLDVADHSRYKILKLHGSMNWIIHPDCAKGPEIAPVHPAEFVIPKGADEGRFNTTIKIRGSPCPRCNYAMAMIPLVIPPTWNKSAGFGIGNVWRHAIYELRNAEQIIIVGYSLPPTDAYFKYLLVSGLKDNDQLKRVIVVNPDAEISKRFADIAPPRVDVISFKYPFSTFVRTMDYAYDDEKELDPSRPPSPKLWFG